MASDYAAKEKRGITADEAAVIRAALERVAVSPEVHALAATIHHLGVVSRCTCGCDSIDFEEYDSTRPVHPIADGVGTTPDGTSVGIIVWGSQNAVTGLEVYGFGESIGRLPIPDSIRPFGTELP
jgi:hypothetical protein